jgi:hypothetical protein
MFAYKKGPWPWKLHFSSNTVGQLGLLVYTAVSELESDFALAWGDKTARKVEALDINPERKSIYFLSPL